MSDAAATDEEKTGFTGLRAVVMRQEGEGERSDADVQTAPDEFGQPADEKGSLRTPAPKVNVKAEIIEGVLRAATSRADRRRLLSKGASRPLAVVFRVPSAVWVYPVAIYLKLRKTI